MLPSIIALLSAIAYGAADFLGGIATHRSTTIAVVVVSQAAGLALLAGAILFLPGSLPGPADLAWGAVAGLAGGAGVALLYRGLAIGPMSVVAPLTAACAALIPVTVGVALGERLTAQRAVAIVLALGAIVLVGQEKKRESTARVQWTALRLALGSGVLIGLFLVLIARASPESGLWPLIPARVASVALFAIAALIGRRSLRVGPAALPAAIAGGALDMVANALYLIAVQRGPLSLMATLVSLYPASTILLARIFLGERLSSLQVAGVGCAALATVMLVSG
jgi:drug/metabolite transporter (DMT)-like permease